MTHMYPAQFWVSICLIAHWFPSLNGIGLHSNFADQGNKYEIEDVFGIGKCPYVCLDVNMFMGV